MTSSGLNPDEARIQRGLADALDPLLPDCGAEDRVLRALRLATDPPRPGVFRRPRFGRWGR
jgi:hypothetical protein